MDVPGPMEVFLRQSTNGGGTFRRVGVYKTRGDSEGELTLNYRTNGKEVDCTIRLSTVPAPLGGFNWYMHCPVTGKRAKKLYKWAALDRFCHREAIRPRPTYASQRDGGHARIIRQRWALRQKMGDEFSDLFGEPCKPRWMRRHTYDKHVARDAELSARDDSYLGKLIMRSFGGLGGG